MNIKALPSQGKIETLEDKQHGFGDHCIYMYKKQYVAIHFKKKVPVSNMYYATCMQNCC